MWVFSCVMVWSHSKKFRFVHSLWLSGWVWMSDIYVLYVICLGWLCVWVVRECY